MSIDLRTRYLGLDLRNPVVASSSPVTGSLETLVRLADAGISAVVLPSLFEERVVTDLGANGGSIARGRGDIARYDAGASTYVSFLREAKQALSIPVMASLNGVSAGGWLRYAELLEEAGADALELNMYLVTTDVTTTASRIETQYLKIVESVRKAVTVPIAVKMAPHFSAVANMARRFVDAGADGLVLFNRFLRPDVDLDARRMTTSMRLSTPAEVGLPLQWAAILRDRVHCSLGATTGVHGVNEVVKLLLAGADVTMMASALLQRGPEHGWHVLTQLRSWLDDNDFSSVAEMRGILSYSRLPDPGSVERGQYIRALVSFASGQSALI